MPRIARRVVCGLSLVIATFSPTSALVSVDLPTFGRPTKVTNPDRNSAGSVRSHHSPLLAPLWRDADLAGARRAPDRRVSAASSASLRSTNTVARPRPRPRDAPPVMTRPSYSAVAPGCGTRPERLAEQTADRVDVLVLELDAEQVADLVESEPGADPVAARLELDDLVGARVVLVGDLADELLDEVLEGHEARHAAVLVDDEADVHGVALHLLQQRLGLHRLRARTPRAARCG